VCGSLRVNLLQASLTVTLRTRTLLCLPYDKNKSGLYLIYPRICIIYVYTVCSKSLATVKYLVKYVFL